MSHITLKNGLCNRAHLIEYPDGQISWSLNLNYFKSVRDPITVTVAITEFKDWEKLLALLSALKINDVLVGHIRFAYVMGCRSDRIFNDGEPHYVRDVVAAMLTLIKEYCPNLSFLEPHGRSEYYFESIGRYYVSKMPDEFSAYQCVAADKSAVHIANRFKPCVIGQYDKPSDPPFFYKTRSIDEEGNREISVTLSYENLDKMRLDERPILICDDLCDGGGTFIAIGKVLKDTFPNRKKYLFVYHGLFTKGVDELFNYYERIYVTNSYKEYNDKRLRVIDVWGL